MGRRFFRSLRAASAGLLSAWRTEQNLRIHTVIAAAVILLALFLQVSALEWGLLLGAIAAVLSVELLNTAIEKLLDHLAPEPHPRTGNVKDIAAAAVLVVSVGAALVGLAVFLPRLIPFLVPSL